MKYGKELSLLVIQNMKVIEIAPKVVKEIEDAIYKGINERCRKYFERQKYNNGFNMHYNKEDIEFYPETDYWKNGDDVICSYYLDYEGEEEINWLTIFLGVYSNAQCLFAYYIDYQKLNINLKQYKNKLTVHYDNNSELKELGFRMSRNSNYIYLPFQLDEKTLLDEYPDNLDTVYNVVNHSLEKIKNAHNIFNKITEDIVKGAGYK